jgi:hypothetical protein
MKIDGKGIWEGLERIEKCKEKLKEENNCIFFD